MEGNNYLQARSYVPRLGLIAGIMWIVSFLLSMSGLRGSWIGQLSTPIGLLSIYIVGRQLQYIRASVGGLSYFRMWALSLRAFMLGTLLTTLAQFVYFQFFDHGVYMQTMEETIKLPEMQKLLKSANDPQMKKNIDLFLSSSPKTLTYYMFLMNMLISFVFSFPTAGVGCIKLRQRK